MGKSKKQVAVVAEVADTGAKMKGKRGLEIENGAKPSKKQKGSEKPKETEKEIEMVEREEPSTKASAISVQNGSGKKNKKARFKSKPQAAKIAPAKNGRKAPKEESEDDDSDSDEEPAKPLPKSNVKASVKGAPLKGGQKVIKQKSSEDDSDDEEVPKALSAKTLAKPPPKKMESSTEEEDSGDSDEEEPKPKKTAATLGKSNNVKVPAKKLESSDKDEGSDDSEEELDSEEEKLMSKSAVSGSEDEDDDDDDEDDDEEEDDEVEKKPKSKIDQPMTPTPSAEGGGSKTVFVKNLAWSVDEDSIQEFFESAGEVLEVRLAKNADGQFRGFGHVEFASQEAAKKACEKSGQMLGGRDVFVDLARERPTPGSEGNRDFKSPRGGGLSGSGGQRSGSEATAFVRGFDKFQGEDSIRSALTNFFGDCGVQSIRLPTDRETGDIKGFAYVDFNDKAALSKAIEYNGSDLNGRSLFVEAAGGGPSSGGGGRGRGRGGDFGGRGRGGDFGGRGGRGRSFGDRGRGGGRGGGGRRGGGRGFGGSRDKGLFGAGKKTTFGDD